MSPNEGISPISQTDLGRTDIGSVNNPDRGIRVAMEKKVAEPDAKEKSTGVAVKAAAPMRTGSDVRLRFEIDEETQRVTVLVIDKKSRKVIRAIPPDELEKFRQGDLFEMMI